MARLRVLVYAKGPPLPASDALMRAIPGALNAIQMVDG